jgi:hypothetical protein
MIHVYKYPHINILKIFPDNRDYFRNAFIVSGSGADTSQVFPV